VVVVLARLGVEVLLERAQTVSERRVSHVLKAPWFVWAGSGGHGSHTVTSPEPLQVGQERRSVRQGIANRDPFGIFPVPLHLPHVRRPNAE